MTIPMPPMVRTHSGTGTFDCTSPVLTMSTTAASGPTELATSLAPCEKATQQEVITTRGANIRSTCSSCSDSGSAERPASL